MYSSLEIRLLHMLTRILFVYRTGVSLIYPSDPPPTTGCVLQSMTYAIYSSEARYFVCRLSLLVQVCAFNSQGQIQKIFEGSSFGG